MRSASGVPEWCEANRYIKIVQNKILVNLTTALEQGHLNLDLCYPQHPFLRIHSSFFLNNILKLKLQRFKIDKARLFGEKKVFWGKYLKKIKKLLRTEVLDI